MKLERNTYKSTTASKTKAAAVVSFVEGKTKTLEGFSERVVLQAGQVKLIRKFLGLTQEGFAQVLRVETSAVENWEQGRRTPDGPVTALMLLTVQHRQIKGWLAALKPKDVLENLHPKQEVP